MSELLEPHQVGSESPSPPVGEGGASRTSGPNVLILGIGNVLWADEGFGVRVVEEIAARFRFGPNVRVLDGGTQGIYLVDHIRWAEVLVVFDAVDYGLPPGTLKLVEGDEVPKFMGAKKMSLHQTGFQEVLAMADLMGDYPRHLLLVGAQPVELEDFGGSLRDEVKAQIEPAIEAARGFLLRFGAEWRPADGQSHEGVRDLPHPCLGMDVYESGRPAPERACRVGDARVLARLGGG